MAESFFVTFLVYKTSTMNMVFANFEAVASFWIVGFFEVNFQTDFGLSKFCWWLLFLLCFQMATWVILIEDFSFFHGGWDLSDIKSSNLILSALQNLLHRSLLFSKRGSVNPFKWYKVSTTQQAVLLWSSREPKILHTIMTFVVIFLPIGRNYILSWQKTAHFLKIYIKLTRQHLWWVSFSIKLQRKTDSNAECFLHI